MDFEKALEKFELFDLRERFTTHVIKFSPFDSEVTIRDEHRDEIVYSYRRNYSSRNPFDIFRLWDDERAEWRYFAAISSNYMTFSILDLESKEVFDSEGSGFCSAEFHAVDFYAVFEDDPRELASFEKDRSGWLDYLKTWMTRRNFMFVSGCYWGDDCGWKLRTVDLTTVLEGRVKETEEKFGYFILKDSIPEAFDPDYFFGDALFLDIQTSVSFKLEKNSDLKNWTIWSMLPGVGKELSMSSIKNSEIV